MEITEITKMTWGLAIALFVFTKIIEDFSNSYRCKKAGSFTERNYSKKVSIFATILFMVIAIYSVISNISQYNIYSDQITAIFLAVTSSLIGYMLNLCSLYFDDDSEKRPIKRLSTTIFKSIVVTSLVFMLFKISNISSVFFSYVQIDMFRNCFLIEIGVGLYFYYDYKRNITKKIKAKV